MRFSQAVLKVIISFVRSVRTGRDDPLCTATRIYEIHIWDFYKNFDSCQNRTKATDTWHKERCIFMICRRYWPL